MVKKQVVVSADFMEKPIALLVQTAGQFSSNIYLQLGTKNINLKSIMGVISIGSLDGKEVIIAVDGTDEQQACDAIVEYLK